MLENAIYSVISPEGCAAILWKTAAAKDKAAQALKLTATDLAALEVIDEVIPEPVGGAHEDWNGTADGLRCTLARHIEELSKLGPEQLLTHRLNKFEAMGRWREVDGSSPRRNKREK
jgi:acetyl-CoA carboxylase carboxyl transferase subunit alpha